MLVSRATYICTYFTEECDLPPWAFEVHFPNGTTTVKFPVNVTDDDLYEGEETFNLIILNELPDRVTLDKPLRTGVYISDDEKSKQFLLSNLCCLFASHKHIIERTLVVIFCEIENTYTKYIEMILKICNF